MVEYILAFIFLAMPDSAPKLLAPYKGDDAKAACFTDAGKRQHDIKDSPQAKEMQAEFVCLKVERVGV